MLNLSTISLALLSVILLIAVVEDLRNHRISNNLVICTFISGTVCCLMNTGLGSIGTVLAGSAMGFFALLPFYLLGGMGAGDVKFFAALGSFLGPFATLWAAALTLVVGALIATGVFVYYRFYGSHRSEPTKAEQKNTNGKVVMSFPYAPAIALGTIGTILMA